MSKRRRTPASDLGPSGSTLKKQKRSGRRRHHKKVNAFPKDDKRKPVHLTSFIGYKAGVTHVVRDGKKANKEEVVMTMTIVETPPMIVVGLVGYIDTPKGLRTFKTVWAEHLSDEFFKNWHSTKKAFSKASLKWQDDSGKKEIEKDLSRIKRYCSVVRIIAHPQLEPMNRRQKKSRIVEIQLNGGSVPEKVEWARSHLEKPIPVQQVFHQDEMIDVIRVPKEQGKQASRWHSRKDFRLWREINKKICCFGQLGVNAKDGRVVKSNASAEYNLTVKTTNQMGGVPQYGVVYQDSIMLRGSVVGPKDGVVVLRKTKRKATEKVNFKRGRGRLQMSEDQQPCMGLQKKAD